MDSPAATTTSYDDLPYESRVLPFTHPIAIATMASLYGLSPPPVETCRVLELGCATGDNLLSMAVTLPQASFVGIDYSLREIDDGLRRLKSSELSNVDLRCLSVMDLQPDEGPFDYIICHGVYSWVAPEVADRILAIFSRHLSPNGIGYISYNTYPGWHIKSILRETLRYHVRDVIGAPQQVAAARNYLHALANSVPKQDEVYWKVLHDGAEDMDRYHDDYVFHEFLEEWNQPLYVHEFIARLAAKQLQYVGPAKFTKWEAAVPADLQQVLDALPDRTAREQYLDHFGNRTFRKSLVCHAGLAVHERPSLAALQRCFISTDLCTTSSGAELTSSAPITFRSAAQDEVTTNTPPIKLALAYVANHAPRAVPVASIWPAISPLLASDSVPRSTEESMLQAILQCFQANTVECMLTDGPYVSAVSLRPVASPLVRAQARQSEWVANLRHRLVHLTDFERMVVMYLDGTRDKAAMCEILLSAMAEGTIDCTESNDLAITDPTLRGAAVKQMLEPCLQNLAFHALLVG